MRKYLEILDLALAIIVIIILRPFTVGYFDLLLCLYAFLFFSLGRSLFEPLSMALVLSTFLLFNRIQSAPAIIFVASVCRMMKTKRGERIFAAVRNFWVSGFAVLIYKIVVSKSIYTGFATIVLIFCILEVIFLVKSKVHKKLFFLVVSMYLALLAANVSFFGSTNTLPVPPITLNFVLFAIYSFLKDYEDERQKHLREAERIRAIRKKLASVIELTTFISQRASVEETLYTLAEAISVVSGFKYVLINIFDRNIGKILRVAHHGIDPNEFQRLKNYPPPIENFYKLAQDRFKLSNSYFIPQGAIEVPTEYVAVLIDQSEAGQENGQQWLPEDMLLVPIYNSDRDIVGYISVDAPFNGKRPSIEDIQILELIADQIYKLLERSQSYQPLVVRVSRDPHTLLLTHSAFLGLLEQQLKSGQEFAVVILDIDDLTKINLQYGHEVGDKVIEKVADVLRSRTRRSDYVARFGGEEFAVLLKNVSKSKAIEITGRMLDEIRQIQVSERLHVTASAGIAMYPEHGKNYEELCDAAFRAMEVAKKSGKDKLMIF